MSRSNVIAVALAGLAVAMAATGTAVAVTATQVNITDPTTPSRVAHVDANGRLTTVGATSTYSSSSLLYNVNGGDNFITAPTTASLALTSLSLSSPSMLANMANTEVRVVLYKENSSSTTSCVPTMYQQLYAWNVAPGDDVTASLAAPMLVKPTGSTPYCLSFYAYVINGNPYGGSFYPFASATWYAAAGTYTAPGTAAKPLTPAEVRRRSSKRGDR